MLERQSIEIMQKRNIQCTYVCLLVDESNSGSWEWGMVIMDWVMQQFHQTNSLSSNDHQTHHISAGIFFLKKLPLSCCI